ncbi:hypothetical protein [Xanthobacter wiegelii]|uniref:hypothetical protein n=1 Tax=Xanthobacter wiegelii TaxID=3119913 RepID=UPI003729CD9C
MIDLSNRNYKDVVTAVILTLTAVSNQGYVYDEHKNEFLCQINKLNNGEIDFVKIAKLLVPHARYEMELGFKIYAEFILYLICQLQFHPDSPVFRGPESPYRLSE